MISELFRKWFGLNPIACPSCEVLREQLHKCDVERRELLTRILDSDKEKKEPVSVEEPQAIQPAFIPWRVKQQMLEAEDRQKAKLMNDKAREIEELEQSLGLHDEVAK